MTTEEYVIKLTQLSVNKLELLKEMLGITKKQYSVITEDSIDALQKTIDAKQIIINQIDEIDEVFNVCFGRLKDVLGIQSVDQLESRDVKSFAELQQVIEIIQNTVKDIQIIQKQNGKSADEVLNKLGGEIKKIAQGKTVTAAYNGGKYNTIAATTSYFDTKK